MFEDERIKSWMDEYGLKVTKRGHRIIVSSSKYDIIAKSHGKDMTVDQTIDKWMRKFNELNASN